MKKWQWRSLEKGRITGWGFFAAFLMPSTVRATPKCNQQGIKGQLLRRRPGSAQRIMSMMAALVEKRLSDDLEG
ncbi:MAG: hypothetical protein RI601_07815 [Desulfurivibrionaceae bacterium]|nr:hypothetical protein [Desulfurivibrionaceae bacterium]